jgi:integrase
VKGTVRKPRTAGGTWSNRLDLGLDAKGKRAQKQVSGFTSKKDAQAALNEALTGVQRGTYIAPSRQTVTDFLTLWVEGVRTEVQVTAWISYKQMVEQYVIPHLGSKRLVELSPMHIKPWHSALLKGGGKNSRPLSSRTVQLCHRVLHRAMADAVRWNLIPFNPLTGVRAPRANSPEMTAWTAEQSITFLTAVADERLIALWTLAMHTGMRRGELAGLRWKDIDLPGSTLTVAQQRTTANYEIVTIKPKGKSQRQLQLADATIAVLTEHRRRQRLERLAAGPAWIDTGYVFVDELGQPYHPQSIYAMFIRACKRADVPAIRLHDLRHTMATLALQAGVHPKIVQEQLGHSAINVTLDIYSHVPQVVKRDAATKIAGLFEG